MLHDSKNGDKAANQEKNAHLAVDLNVTTN